MVELFSGYEGDFVEFDTEREEETMMVVFFKKRKSKEKKKKKKKKPEDARLGCFLYSFLSFFRKLDGDDGSIVWLCW